MFADVNKSEISFIMKTHIPVKLKNRCPKLSFSFCYCDDRPVCKLWTCHRSFIVSDYVY